MSLSEVTKVVESLGEEVRVDQVRQVAHRLGFTRSEVTSLEQVVGGGERASTMLLHLLLVWQKQKHRGKEAGREELAAALYDLLISESSYYSATISIIQNQLSALYELVI